MRCVGPHPERTLHPKLGHFRSRIDSPIWTRIHAATCSFSMSPDLAASSRSWFTSSMSTKGSPACPAFLPDRPAASGLPTRTCRPTHADLCMLMRQTILLPVDPCCSIRRSQGVVLAAQSRSRRASCSDRRLCAQKSVPSALAARLPPNAPPNPTVHRRPPSPPPSLS